MQDTGPDESQAGIKIARRNNNNLRYADDATLMAESEEELKNLLMRAKEESEKTGLKHNVQKTYIMESGLIISWQINWGKSGNSGRFFFFFVSKITVDSDCSHELKGWVLLGKKAMTHLDSVWKSRDITLLTKVHIVKAM